MHLVSLQEGLPANQEGIRQFLRLFDWKCGPLQVGAPPSNRLRLKQIPRCCLRLMHLTRSSCSYESCDGPGACGYDLHDGEGVAWGQEGKYSTTLFTQRARKILESHNPTERPLFLLLSLQVSTPRKTESDPISDLHASNAHAVKCFRLAYHVTQHVSTIQDKTKKIH